MLGRVGKLYPAWLALIAVLALVAVAVGGTTGQARHSRYTAAATPASPPGDSDALPALLAYGEQLERARVEAARQAEEARLAAEQELARQAEEARRAATTTTRPAPRQVAAPPPSSDCYGVNQFAAYIYMRESGCNPANPGNPNCEGIGQACPRGKMGCSWEDVACQLAWFENYAFSRYGSWENAYAFWLAHHWW